MGVSITDVEGMKGLISEEFSAWTEPMEITQEMVNTFADVTDDHQWIHVDIERSKAGPFGGTIVHGFYTLSLVPHFGYMLAPDVEGVMGVLNYGGDRLRFLAPVPVGSKLHARSRIVDVTHKANGVLLKTEMDIRVVGSETPAVLYESLSLYLPG